MFNLGPGVSRIVLQEGVPQELCVCYNPEGVEEGGHRVVPVAPPTAASHLPSAGLGEGGTVSAPARQHFQTVEGLIVLTVIGEDPKSQEHVVRRRWEDPSTPSPRQESICTQWKRLGVTVCMVFALSCCLHAHNTS